MVLAEAEGLLDGDVHVPLVDPQRDAAALRALSLWTRRFSPLTCADPPNGIRMNIRGCGHLFGGDAALIQTLHASLGAMGFAASVRLASNYAMAWGQARFGGDEASDAAALPMQALRFEREVFESLAEVGVETVRHVLDIPRAEFISRFGDAAVARIDAWTGREVQRGIDAAPPRVNIRAEQVFDGPVRDLRAVQMVVAALASEIAKRLTRQNRGAEQIDVHLERADLDDWKWSMRLTHPSRDVGHFHAVLRERIDRIDIASGIESVTLHVPRDVPMDAAQQMAWRDDGHTSPRLDHARGALIDMLQERCGHRRVLVRHPIDTHVPEDAARPLTRSAGAPLHRLPTLDSRLHRGEAAPDRPTRIISARRVEVRLPDGKVVGVLQGGRKRWKVVAAVGPERLQTPWWPPGSRSETRDYWRLQRADGQWVWVYRRDDGWYLQGAWL